MSTAAVKYYYSHKDKVLAYKKDFYAKKMAKYSYFKNIKIKNISKRQSNEIIKTAIDLNILTILLGEECKEYQLSVFIELYKFKDFSIIEIDCQFIKEEGHLFYEHLYDLHNFSSFVNQPYAKVKLHIFENQILKLEL
jgi:hypothetical protein